MDLFILDSDITIYQSLRPYTTTDMQVFHQFDGTPKRNQWSPVTVKLFRESDFFEGKSSSDFPYVAPGVPVLSGRAVHVLQTLIEPYGEILPLLCEDGQYSAFNATTYVDALDLVHAELDFFPNSTRIMNADRYEFVEQRLQGVPIFKVPQIPRGVVFVTDEFVHRVTNSALTGFLFKPVWTST